MKNSKNINALLEKYFTGETSLEEEKILRGYFNGTDIDPQLKSYTPLFQFFEIEEKKRIGALDMSKIKGIVVAETPTTLKILRGGNFSFKVLKMAAAITLLVVSSVFVFKQFNPPQKPIAQKKARVIVFDENTDPELALAELEKALSKASRKLKKGTDETTESFVKVSDATEVLRGKK